MSSVPLPPAEAALLIRRPVAEVFQAFIDPAIAARFWFSRSSGPLNPGALLNWDWLPSGLRTEVAVRELQPQEQITYDWDAYGEASRVELQFQPVGSKQTFVRFSCAQFPGAPDQAAAAAADFAESHALILAGLKALLEHHVVLNLIADRGSPLDFDNIS